MHRFDNEEPTMDGWMVTMFAQLHGVKSGDHNKQEVTLVWIVNTSMSVSHIGLCLWKIVAAHWPRLALLKGHQYPFHGKCLIINNI